MRAEIILKTEQPNVIVGRPTLRGIIKVECDKYCIVRAFHLTLIGKMKARSWGNFGSKHNPAIYPLSYAAYFEITKQKRRYVRAIDTGVHRYAFEFYMRPDCLSSMEGSYGHIRYELILYIDHPRLGETIVVMPVSVLRQYSLKENPIFAMPQEVKLQSNLFMILMRCTLRYTLKTPIRGYAPGEVIHFTLEVHDKGSTQVLYHEVRFIKKTSYTFDNRSGYGSTTFVTLFATDIRDNDENDQVITGEILIPSTPPTFSTEIISVEYYIEAKAKVSLCSPKFRIELPIIIGTNTIKPVEIPAEETEKEKDTRLRAVPLVFEPAEGNEDPFVDYDLEEEYRCVGFLPLYPSYRE